MYGAASVSPRSARPSAKRPISTRPAGGRGRLREGSTAAERRPRTYRPWAVARAGSPAGGRAGGEEEEIDVVDLPDLLFREHGGQGGQDRGDRALVHLVGLDPLQEDSVGREA